MKRLAAMAILALAACSTKQVAPEKIICVAESVSVGDRIRLNDQSRLGAWTEPEPYAITSLHGRSRHCPTEQRPITARAVPASVANERLAKSREPKREFRGVAQVEAGDIFPAGTLHLATHTFRRTGSEDAAAWLVVNFGASSDKGERSYVADTVANCKTGALSVAWWTTHGQADGAGDPIAAQAHPSAQKIEKPSAALATAGRAICSLTGDQP